MHIYIDCSSTGNGLTDRYTEFPGQLQFCSYSHRPVESIAMYRLLIKLLNEINNHDMDIFRINCHCHLNDTKR